MKIRQIQVGEILYLLVTAGVTDIGNVEFLISEPSTVLDQAREAAIAVRGARPRSMCMHRAFSWKSRMDLGGLWICRARSDADTGGVSHDVSVSANH